MEDDVLKDIVKPETTEVAYASYKKRLVTFKPTKWFAMPPELSPLVAAMLGWYNVDIGLLQCECCARKLSKLRR